MVDLARVVVVGTSGSGKTTFAREIAGLLGSPHVELDALYWGPDWSVRADFVERVGVEAARPVWVMDGNYSLIRDIVWPRSTAIVWLDYSLGLTFTRALRRTVRRMLARERLWSSNRETLWAAFVDRDWILWWVLRTYWRRRREMPTLMARAEFAHVVFSAMRTPRDAEAFLRGLCERRRDV